MENYSSMKLELLALKWAVTEKFREYLLGNHFTILTDNNPLSHLQTAKLGAIEQRWAAQLASFNFSIKYRPGRSNGNADALSRQYLERFTSGTAVPLLGALAGPSPVSPAEAQCEEVVALPGRTAQDLSQLQGADPVIGPIRGFFQSGRRPRAEEREVLSNASKSLLRQWDRLALRDEVLYRVVHIPGSCAETFQLLLPQCLHEEVLRMFMITKGTRAQSGLFSSFEADVFGQAWRGTLSFGAGIASGVSWGRQCSQRFGHTGERCKLLNLMRS